MTRIVVFGAGGYIGSKLVAWLETHTGVEVRAVHHRRPPWASAGKQWFVDLLAAGDQANMVTACDGAEALVHLAGANEVAASRDPEAAIADTVRITQRVAAAANAAGISRVVYLSTIHVYGARLSPGALVTEELRPEPRHPYAIARLASEHVLASTVADPLTFRLTNSVGAPVSPAVNRWSLVANDLCRQAATEGRLRLRTAGTQWRDFVALSDVCAILAGATGVVPAERHVSLPATGYRPPLVAPPPEPDAPGPYMVSTARLAGAGWSTETPLDTAIDDTLRFCLTHRHELSREI